MGDAARAAPVEFEQWETVTLAFEGPDTSENSDPNPFTDYRLLVRFSQGEKTETIRGFYAADGNAAETSADGGNIWKVRFAPDSPGKWRYEAALRRGEQISISDDPNTGELVSLPSASGSFRVKAGAQKGKSFRAHGRLIADNGYFRFKASGKYWLKGGADSPENFLGYADFDGTYKGKLEARDGEATPDAQLHAYAAHVQDWKPGNPTWKDGKGKGIVGAINYLSSTGMNAVYFLTLNILGDGRDVWPYANSDDHTRFDCSKLDQWEIVFQHMQDQGVLLHLVTQETENELLLDNGETGPLRKLYYSELIARFGHHLGLVWNLGEENGPAEFSPNGQTTAQRKAMAAFLKSRDPYNHPVVLHTHAHSTLKDELLPDLLGFKAIDGLSFQVDHREQVAWRSHQMETAG